MHGDILRHAMTTLAQAREAVDYYQSRFRHPALDRFDVAPLYALFPEPDWPRESGWLGAYPYPTRAGVYLIFDKDKNLLYVGKADGESGIGGRLSAHFHYGPNRECSIVGESLRLAAFVLVVAVSEESWFEACSLEAFLISRLAPAVNKMGKPAPKASATAAP